ncbi:MAG TPA: NAD(P)H-hydrate dehydratase [Pyrinomonadaceae bacterium]|nr:NAD(P)H-hydrate dehydratase [Chloracidobacterium sp.]MBP9936262.1 NAD(P)H-hydrate dehydratase [Pyrinomonadaceae bacterium]MBK7802224.1 NAD(P)H-hydrate dehydratase [Chloracidobacterium sp.]MBL0239770.1 NAD(P)H-hydrate dehydratase [Chloracidobacterium sp.]HQY66436.1 NAD(P)H-hydrate dehydratase [Pyrinomonadaceae bacterium]
MQYVLTAEQMREVDRKTVERFGIPSIVLMENAAQAAARIIIERLGGSVRANSILLLCGKGNNGGDGAAIARLLAMAGANVDVFLFGEIEDTVGDARTNFEICKRLNDAEYRDDVVYWQPMRWTYRNEGGGINFIEITDKETFYEMLSEGWELGWVALVDAICGTGLNGELRGMVGEITEQLSKWDKYQIKGLGDCLPIFSIDMPSGLRSDHADADGPHLRASVTITFTAPKPAQVLPPASNAIGELIVVDIGSPSVLLESLEVNLFLADESDAVEWLEECKFQGDSYKNKRGHALLIAGSDNYSGAAVLCGNAAMRSGAGLVTIATPKSSKDSVAARVLPEVMVRGVAETKSGSLAESAFEEIGDLLEKADAVAIGSGISQDESTHRFVQKVITNRNRPVIVDADALNLLSPALNSWEPANESGGALILTPHEGEFMRLLGTDDKALIKDRVEAVRDFAVRHSVILVLKGERVLIGAPDGRVVVNPTGNSGLGKAGNGDTLTGILTGFAAQAVKNEIDMFSTVVAAVYIAGMAGDVAEQKYGKRVMTASDVRECLVEVFGRLAAK